MKIINETSNENIRKACAIVLKHYKDDEFLKMVKEIDTFNYTSDPGIIVAHKIQSFNGEVRISSYRPFWRWSKAIAYEKNDVVYFNEYIDAPVLDRVETIAHEIYHAIGYSHKGNYVNQFNISTVPYLCANLFKKYVSEKLGDELAA